MKDNERFNKKFKKKFKKIICGVISASMILSAAPFVFAAGDGTDTAVVTDTEAEATATPDTEATATPDSTENPDEATATPDAEATSTPEIEEISVRLNATVYSTSTDDVYKVVFKTGATLPEILGFKFTASFDDATISSTEFGESFADNGDVSRSITDDKSVTYIWKNGVSSVSGAVVLSNATVTADGDITSSNLSISDFTVTLADGTEAIIAAELNIIEGTNMPDLSEKEQAVYDELTALPAIDSLSFYRSSGKLTDVETYYCDPIDEAIEDYEALSSSSQTKVSTALSVGGTTYSTYTTLQRAANSMKNLYSVMQLSEAYDGIEEGSEALNYEYVKLTFESLSTDTPTALKRASTALSEYEAALADYDVYNGYVESALDAVSDKTADNYNIKIAALDVQLESANNLSSHELYTTYRSMVLSIANDLYDDIDDNYSGSYKSYMLASIENVIDTIESGSTIVSNLPTFELPNGIDTKYSVSITFKRASSLKSQDATVYVITYDEEGDTIYTSPEKSFSSGNTELSTTISSSYYTSGDVVTVAAYYKYDGVSYYLGSVTTTVYTSSSKTSGNTTSFSTGGSSSSSSGSTIYPSSGSDTTASSTAAPSYADENPYTDIDNYDWALEAIIGLTNAGIVNGMGDNEFNPAGEVTREQFCKMVDQMYGLDTSDTSTYFVDVDTTKWYAPYVTAAVNAGFVQGQSDEYFGIGESIMRQDMATILYRAIDMTGDEVELDFTDADNIAEYAKEAVAELVGLGIMNGYEDGSFKPRGSATRAEAAKVIWGIYNIL